MTMQPGRRQLGVAAALLALLAAGVVLYVMQRDPGVPADVAFPDPSFDPVASASVTISDFAGAEACISCHTAKYDEWAASTHGNAGGIPAPDLLIAPFDGTPIEFADGSVIPRADGEGGYEFVIRQDGHEEIRMPVDGVVGGGHMLGGGTQGFFTEWIDGTMRFLPFDWSRDEGRWFCNSGPDAGQRAEWIPLGTELRLSDCVDWMPKRILGTTVDRFTACGQCHGSQIQLERAAGEGYRTSFASLQINCESCHGPAARHVELARSDGFGADGDIGVESLTNLPKDASLAVCLTCHGLSSTLKEGYLPGEPVEEYYALKYPALASDPPNFPDGRVRTFAYQANHLSSACYLEGPMDCVSCHEPHSQGYWDVNKQPLAGPFDDGQCTACHVSKAESPELHTFHPPESSGSGCVNCHMPYLQHPQIGTEVRYSRSDHVIPVPRPAFDDSLGITSACVQCHTQPVDELQEQVEAWWGAPKPHRPLIEALSDPQPASPSEAAARFLRPDQIDPMTQFQALGRLLFEWLPRHDPDADPETIARLRALGRDPDLDVRTLALAALHWVAGHDPDVRRFLATSLEEAVENGTDEAVRRRWNLALVNLGTAYEGRQQIGTAEAAYRKALEILPEDSRTLQLLGIMYAQANQPERATAILQRSATADPRRSDPLVALGSVLSWRGESAGAEGAYRSALGRNPYDPLARYTLGDLLLAQGQVAEGLEELRLAVEADPGNGEIQFELARALARAERYAEALPHARRAAEFQPQNLGARQMVRQLEELLAEP